MRINWMYGLPGWHGNEPRYPAMKCKQKYNEL